jgi:uncharacterized protein
MSHSPPAMKSIASFDFRYQSWTLRGDTLAGAIQQHALLLHGAGASSRATYTQSGLRQALCARGIGSTAFDCIGHGDSDGLLTHSSVASRTQQAAAVIAARRLPAPLALCGSSMGAYNAIKLTQTQQIAALVLIVPGVYTPQAYDVPFGPQFSAIIRRECSWRDSDAWDIVAQFRGDLLVLAAAEDEVIPLEIPERLVQSATQARSRRLQVVAGATHKHLFALLRAERPAEFEQTIENIAHCLQARPVTD